MIRPCLFGANGVYRQAVFAIRPHWQNLINTMRRPECSFLAAFSRDKRRCVEVLAPAKFGV
jgi:hypothetical protein